MERTPIELDEMVPAMLKSMKALCAIIRAIDYAEFNPGIERPPVSDTYLDALDIIASIEGANDGTE